MAGSHLFELAQRFVPAGALCFCLAFTGVLHAEAEDSKPPETPRVRGVENDQTYTTTVKPAFSQPPGQTYKAVLTRNDEDPDPFRSGSPVYRPGDYTLLITAKKQSNGKTRTASINFTIEKATLALLDIKGSGGVPQSVGDAAAELLKTDLLKTTFFHLIERSNIERVLKEQAFQQTGCTDSACAVKIGQLLAAQKLLVGTITKPGAKYLLSVQIMDVAKGKLDFAESVSFESPDDLETATAFITKKISAGILGVEEKAMVTRGPPRTSVLWRSTLIPGWGQYYEDRSQAAGVFFFGAAALGANYALSLKSYSKARADYNGTLGIPMGIIERDTLVLNYFLLQGKRSAYESAYNRAKISFALMTAFWLAGMLDALLEPGTIADFFSFAQDSGERRASFAIAPMIGPAPNERGYQAAVRFSF